MRKCASHPRVSAILLAAALAAAPACRTTPSSSAAGIDLAGMDKSVAPGDDFNAYTNGGWIKATPIPADKSSYGAGAILADQTRERLRALFQESSSADRRNRRRPEDRRLLLHLHGRSRHRVQGNRSAEAPTRRDRGHRGSPRSRPRAGRAVARGCGSAEQHQLRDRQPLRNLDRTGPRRPVAQFPLSAPGRSRNARPRLLCLHQRPHGRSAQTVPGAHRGNV